MATALLVRPTAPSEFLSLVDVVAYRGVADPGGITIVSVAIGAAGACQATSTAAATASLDFGPAAAVLIDAFGTSRPVDGLVFVLDSSIGTVDREVLNHRVESIWGIDGLAGRPVGVVVIGSDHYGCSLVLESMRSMVKKAKGFSVGVGVMVDTTDGPQASITAGGPAELSDVTVASQLALLGRRVRDLAAARVDLRACA